MFKNNAKLGIFAIIVTIIAAIISEFEIEKQQTIPFLTTSLPTAYAQEMSTIGGLTLKAANAAGNSNNSNGSNETNIVIKGEHTLTLTSTASVKLKPDQVTVGFNVHTEARTAHDALGNNTMLISRVREAILASGVPENQTETTRFHISPDYDYNARPPLLVGYNVDNTLQITTPMIENISSLIDAAVAAGATGISQVNFGISDPVRTQVKTELIRNATQNARAQADLLAEDLEVKVVDVQSISANVNQFVATTGSEDEIMSRSLRLADNFAMPSIVAPSGLTMEVTVVVTFVIEKVK
jgi:uncharacterized protein YggE